MDCAGVTPPEAMLLPPADAACIGDGDMLLYAANGSELADDDEARWAVVTAGGGEEKACIACICIPLCAVATGLAAAAGER